MPKLGNVGDMDVMKIAGGGAFQFSAVKMDNLGATEYTLVTIALDTSGSLQGCEDDLKKTITSIVDACQKSPRAENLMLRYIQFNSKLNEVHGFKLLSTIQASDYDRPRPDGRTALHDATYSSIGATLTYAKKLIEQDFNCNGICFIITDGLDNESKTSPAMIAEMAKKAKIGEDIESMITVLIGINTKDADVQRELPIFAKEAELTQYVDAGDATPGKLAKLAAFVSKSISSQSQALGTGGPSQTLGF
jgi:uncharacterized protein YegL